MFCSYYSYFAPFPLHEHVTSAVRQELTLAATHESRFITGPTDLSRTLAGPQLLEQIWRGHGTIEDRLHYVWDETLGEDRGQTHMGSVSQALAALRNGILSLLRYHGWSNIAEANRRYDACPQKALQLLGGLSP
jgi:hypothetical protein